MAETWACHYEPELKRQSMKWKLSDSPVKKKFMAQRSVKNVMLIVFLKMNGLISTDFLEKGATEKHCFIRQTPSNFTQFIELSLYIYIYLFE